MSAEDKFLPGHLAVVRMIELTVHNLIKTPQPTKQELDKASAVLTALFQTLITCNIPRTDLPIVIGRCRNAVSNARPGVKIKICRNVIKDLEARTSLRHKTNDIIRGVINRLTGQ